MEWRHVLPAGASMNLAQRLRDGLLLERGHAVISGDSNAFLSGEIAVEAAVLIAITDRPEPGLILTQRPETMRRHPGQVAFPGGRVDPGDADVIAAALREAEEEIALPRHLVNVIGPVPPYRTVTDYRVTPIIGVIPPDLPLIANAEEVAAIFEMPLSVALNLSLWQDRTVDWAGQERHFHEMHWEGFRIWGATASMIVNLARQLRWHG
jgi:8-oxo-dGTP pyrophosphatase MutT (NUDIX family)